MNLQLFSRQIIHGNIESIGLVAQKSRFFSKRFYSQFDADGKFRKQIPQDGVKKIELKKNEELMSKLNHCKNANENLIISLEGVPGERKFIHIYIHIFLLLFIYYYYYYYSIKRVWEE